MAVLQATTRRWIDSAHVVPCRSMSPPNSAYPPPHNLFHFPASLPSPLPHVVFPSLRSLPSSDVQSQYPSAAAPPASGAPLLLVGLAPAAPLASSGAPAGRPRDAPHRGRS